MPVNHFRFPIPETPEDAAEVAAFLVKKAMEGFGPVCGDFEGAGCAVVLPYDAIERAEQKVLEGAKVDTRAFFFDSDFEGVKFAEPFLIS